MATLVMNDSRLRRGARWVSQREPGRWRRPPGRWFHLALGVPVLGLLWSHSVPGINIILWAPSVLAIVVLALLWATKLISHWVTKRSLGHGRWFLVAPIGGIIVLGLIVGAVPLRTRWAISRPAFEKVVDEAMQDKDYDSIDERRLGTFQIIDVHRDHNAVIFSEVTGSFSDDAGFAYLPDGPFPELENTGFESPEFRHLGGSWYAWTASW